MTYAVGGGGGASGTATFGTGSADGGGNGNQGSGNGVDGTTNRGNGGGGTGVGNGGNGGSRIVIIRYASGSKTISNAVPGAIVATGGAITTLVQMASRTACTPSLPQLLPNIFYGN